MSALIGALLIVWLVGGLFFTLGVIVGRLWDRTRPIAPVIDLRHPSYHHRPTNPGRTRHTNIRLVRAEDFSAERHFDFEDGA